MTTTPNTSTALTRAPAQSNALANFNRITRDAVSVAEALEKAQTIGHLVSPATSCGSLPEGTSVALSAVLVDVARETYGIAGGGDKVGLGKVALDRIALAAGVSWDPQQSRRTDDGRDPHYVSYVAVGHYRQFDGSTCTIMGEKELDMREKSPAVEALRAKYREKLAAWERGGKQDYPPKSPDVQIAEVRTHLLSHAASKAKLRAIRGLGIRTSYTKAELAKPFVIAKLTFSGETENPELRREFALMRARSFLNSRDALWGNGPRQLPPPPPPRATLPAVRPAPPVGQVVDEDPDGVIDGVMDAELVEESIAPEAPPPGHAADAGTPAPEPSQSSTSSERPPVQQTRAAARAAASGFAIPGGRSKGTPLEEADDRDLTYWGGRLEQELADGTGKPQFRDRNEALARAIRAEQGRRAGGDADDGGSSGGGDFEAAGHAGGDDDDIPF